MKSIVISVVAADMAITVPAMAKVGLAAKSNCLVFQKADAKLVEPAYRDVAKKYAGVKGAEAMLIASRWPHLCEAKYRKMSSRCHRPSISALPKLLICSSRIHSDISEEVVME